MPKKSSAVECTSLDGYFLEPFRGFAPAMIAERLGSVPDQKLVGVMYAGLPVGLSVVEVHPATGFASIKSFFVDSRFRGKGIGRRLLESTEEEVFAGGAPAINTEWLADGPSAGSLQRIFELRGWSTPKVTASLYRYRGSGIDHFLRNTKVRKLSSGCELFPWKDLTQEDDAALESLRTGHGIPIGLDPHGEKFMAIDEEKSVGLRWRGELSGWMILHRYGTKKIRYTSLWVNPSLIGRGLGISIAAEACRRHRACMDADDMGFFVTASENTQMHRFLDRRLHGGFESISGLLSLNKKRVVSPG